MESYALKKSVFNARSYTITPLRAQNHQAEGLEWPMVFIPWLADGRFPTDLAINTKKEEEEERRVFHVAVTRPKDELYLVVPQVYRS